MDSLTTSHVAQYGALAGLSAWAAWSLWRLAQLRGALQAAAEQLGAATAELQARDKALSAERAGRMRAEQRLTDAKKVHAAALVAAAAAAADGGGDQPLLARLPVEPLLEGGAACHKLLYPMRPIGHIKSCFSQRNGTPRQPHLVPAARSLLLLADDVSPTSLAGLSHYSHVWVLYFFHANTDLEKVLPRTADRSKHKALIHVPRLNGATMGVLATRSPHRPNAIGLSTARVLRVDERSVLLGGADIVDGSPVLDVKPYVPFCDALAGATCPPWVALDADDEPLRMSRVDVLPQAAAQLADCWRRGHRTRTQRRQALYPDADVFAQLVRQVLCRDIRSVERRLHGGQLGSYHVILDGVDVVYDVDDERKVVTVVGAAPAQLRHDGDPKRHITKYDSWWRQQQQQQQQQQQTVQPEDAAAAAVSGLGDAVSHKGAEAVGGGGAVSSAAAAADNDQQQEAASAAAAVSVPVTVSASAASATTVPAEQ